MGTHELLVRRLKRPAEIKETKWEYEVGEAPPRDEKDKELMASSLNPLFLRKDTPKAFQFRIRNLPYPEDVYSVEVDPERQQVVVRTSNKKYFKRIDIPDMRRAGAKLDPAALSFSYGSNTLVVSYEKPVIVLKREADLRREFEKLNKKGPKEGDFECMQQ
jgi:hypothetical protein